MIQILSILGGVLVRRRSGDASRRQSAAQHTLSLWRVLGAALLVTGTVVILRH